MKTPRPIGLTSAMVLLLGGCTLGYFDGYRPSGDGVTYGEVGGGVFPIPPVTSLTFMPGADRKTFESIGEGFAKDKGHVWYKGRELRGADPGTFKRLDYFFSVDARHAYYHETLLEGSQAASFKILGSGFSSDGVHVYWMGDSLNVTNAAAFRVTGIGLWAIDGAGWWRGNERADKGPDGIDAATYEVIRKGPRHYSRDRQGVYFGGEPIVGADRSTFAVIEGQDGLSVDKQGVYSRDRTSVYRSGKPVAGADPSTFTLVDAQYDYTRDAAHVFCDGQPIQANPATFRSLGMRWATDNEKVFFSCDVVEGAKADTFVMKNPRWGHDGVSWWYLGERLNAGPGGADIATYEVLSGGRFSKDKRVVLFDNYVLKDADPSTFTALSASYGADAKNVFCERWRVGGADPATFRAVGETHGADAKNAFYRYYRLEGVNVGAFREIDENLATDGRAWWYQTAHWDSRPDGY